tara:strand:- start:1704 stop:2153 length:450 start_codon:yes stop_codon:yes gene_type:complete
MGNPIILKHARGAPGLRLFGLGRNFLPIHGVKQLQLLLRENTSWANQRSTKDIKKMLSHSTVVVSMWESKTMIGFGRASTDRIYRAVLWDVVIDKNYQSKGFGEQLIHSILKHPYLLGVEKIYIMTTNCQNFYSKIGFNIEKNQKLMTL